MSNVGEVFNKLAVYLVETSFKISKNFSLSSVESKLEDLNWFGTVARNSLNFSTV